ncbi:GNAT family N-acetyltransferase [Kribbella sp. NPDC000426]|uniref:GNAT family N-acetyltransferase n=1 Tax=Kribbella sp. NPDC000426 TaxID=3154255 RepID=UPI003317DDF7
MPADRAGAAGVLLAGCGGQGARGSGPAPRACGCSGAASGRVCGGERKGPQAGEILWAAVDASVRGQGIGRRLVDDVLRRLRADGVRPIEVKTLDATAKYEPYDATRAFWERMGFVQIDTIDPLPGWSSGNPAAIYVAALESTTARRPSGD